MNTFHNNKKPIGVFDSGLGGLTVVKALRKRLPNESVVYLGDTARVPYGNKSQKLIQEYSLQIADFLISKGAKMIVVACNTASALAIEALKESVSVPVVGVIESGVVAAMKSTQNKHIGVIGTIATISSGTYRETLVRQDDHVVVASKECPLFVPLVEEGWLTGPATEMIVREYLDTMKKDSIDTLILGCTHYPLLKPIIQKIMTDNVTLVDSAEAIAETTADILSNNSLAVNLSTAGSLQCYVTDLPARFEDVARRFLGEKIPRVQTIHL